MSNEEDVVLAEALMREAIQPCVDYANKWWDHINEYVFQDTGTFPLRKGPPGMHVRFTRAASHSAVKGVNAFPFVNLQYINLHCTPPQLIEDICGELVIDGLRLLCKKNMFRDNKSSLCIAFVPTALMELREGTGRFVYLSGQDLIALSGGTVLTLLRERAAHYVVSTRNIIEQEGDTVEDTRPKARE